MSNHRNTSRELRHIFSGSDTFMQDGHQIINSNRAYAGPKRKDSPWASDDKTVQELLKTVFPKLEDNKRQRDRAGRWMRVIQLHFRSGFSYGDTAEEMGEELYTIRNIISRMRRALKRLPGGVKMTDSRDTTETSMGRLNESGSGG
jgi:hypothetical protein